MKSLKNIDNVKMDSLCSDKPRTLKGKLSQRNEARMNGLLDEMSFNRTEYLT